jgi:transposase
MFPTNPPNPEAKGSAEIPSGMVTLHLELQRLTQSLVTMVKADDAGVTKAVERAVEAAFANLDKLIRDVVDRAVKDVVEQHVRQYTTELLWSQEFREDLAAYVRAKVRGCLDLAEQS